MPLSKQIIPMSFSQGVDTKTDPKQLPPGKLLLLKNGYFQESKEIIKRNGYEPYPTNVQNTIVNIDTGISIFNYRKEILLQDKNNLYSFSPDQKWVNKSINLRNFDYSVKPVQFDAVSKGTPSASYDPVNDFEFYVYTNEQINNHVFYSIIERSTGNLIADNLPLESVEATQVQIQYISGKWIAFYTAAGALRYAIVDPAHPLASPVLNVITSTLTINSNFDTTKIGGEIFISTSETGSLINIYKITSSFTLQLRRSLIGPSIVFTLGISGNFNTRILVMYSDPGAPATYLKVFDDTNLAGPEPTKYLLSNRTSWTITAYVDSLGDAKIFYFSYGDTGFVDDNSIYEIDFSHLNVASIPLVKSSGLLLQSKVFFLNNYLYYFVCPMSSKYINGVGSTVTTTEQQGLYLMGYDFINFQNVVYQKTESGTYGFKEDAIRCLPEVCFLNEDGYQKFIFAYLKKSRVVVQNQQIDYIFGVQSLSSFESLGSADREIIAESLNFTGGQLWQYDGSEVVESGFNIFPAISTNVGRSQYGGGLGTYGATTDVSVEYVAVYEWTDQNGNLHRSAPSDPVKVNVFDSTPPSTLRPAYTFLAAAFLQNAYDYGTTDLYEIFTQNVAIGDRVSGANIPINSIVTEIFNVSGKAFFNINNTPPQVYNFFTAQRDATTGAGSYTVTTQAGQTSIEVFNTSGDPAPGAFKIGQRLKTIPGNPSGFPDGSIIVDDFGGGSNFYTINNPAPAAGTYFVYSPDSQEIFLNVRNTSLTDKDNISLVLYRTTVNGTIFYRVTSTMSPTFNNKFTFQSSMNDVLTDSQLIANEELYTTSGEVENIAPPALEFIQFYKNRLMGVPKDNKNQFWYSKQAIDGYGLEFNDSFVLNVNAPGGEISAAGVLDEKFIIFKKNQIYYMLGEGPNPMGLQNDFTPTQLISADTGCIENRSLINIPEGLMFKSEKGMYLLNRSLAVEYIGDAVEQFNQYGIVSARLMKEIQQVRFGLSNGLIMTYDYYHKQWGFYEGQNDSIIQNDAEIVNGDYHILNSSGILKKENTGYADYMTSGGNQVQAYIPISLDTGWLSFGGLETFQRIYKFILMGDYKSNHLLSIQVYYDFNEGFFDTIPVDNTASTPINNVYEYRLFMPRQKCTSVRFKIVESQFLTTIGEGLKLSSISFEVGLKKGLNKIKASESYG